MLPRRMFIVSSLSLFTFSCTRNFSGKEASLTTQQAIDRVKQAKDSLAKQVSLAVINSARTKSRIDRHGLPAWTWRDGAGNDGYGSCVHIHPKTGQPYLENQFPKSKRPFVPKSPKGRQPQKYILFNLSGPWHARVHHLFPVEWEENWQHPQANRDGELLLNKLAILLHIK